MIKTTDYNISKTKLKYLIINMSINIELLKLVCDCSELSLVHSYQVQVGVPEAY